MDVGGEQEMLTISRGRVCVEQGPFVMPSCDFAIVADRLAWTEFVEDEPRPGRNDLFALLRNGLVRFHGDLQPLFANLQYFKDVLAAPRHIEASA